MGEGEAWQGADLGLPGPALDPAPGGGACPRLLWGSAPARRERLSHSYGHWGGAGEGAIFGVYFTDTRGMFGIYPSDRSREMFSVYSADRKGMFSVYLTDRRGCSVFIYLTEAVRCSVFIQLTERGCLVFI